MNRRFSPVVVLSVSVLGQVSTKAGVAASLKCTRHGRTVGPSCGASWPQRFAGHVLLPICCPPGCGVGSHSFAGPLWLPLIGRCVGCLVAGRPCCRFAGCCPLPSAVLRPACCRAFVAVAPFFVRRICSPLRCQLALLPFLACQATALLASLLLRSVLLPRRRSLPC